MTGYKVGVLSDASDSKTNIRLVYRNGGPADTLALVAYLFLAFGVLHFPLDAPLIDRDDA